MRSINTLLSLVAVVVAHGDHSQTPIAGPHKGLWYNSKPYELPGDGGTQVSILGRSFENTIPFD
jgi:agmatinase